MGSVPKVDLVHYGTGYVDGVRFDEEVCVVEEDGVPETGTIR